MTYPEVMDLGPEPSSPICLYDKYSKELEEFTQGGEGRGEWTQEDIMYVPNLQGWGKGFL